MRSFLTAPGSAAVAALVLAAATASAAPPRSVHAIESATFYFRARDGTVLTLLMVQLLADRPGAESASGGADPDFVAAASFEESGRHGEELPGAEHHAIPLGATAGVPKDDSATFYGQAYLEPGRSYLMRYVVKDAAREEIFMKNALLSVPYLTGGFSASSVVPAEQFGPAGAGAGLFQVGSEEVVPKPGGVFRRDEPLRLYLQVYDARTDPETANRRVDLVYRFYRSVHGSSKRYGNPYTVRGATGPSMGLALPIGDWLPGSYRVVVELHDRIAAARTETEGFFSIRAD
jgi:hypothetical protein